MLNVATETQIMSTLSNVVPHPRLNHMRYTPINTRSLLDTFETKGWELFKAVVMRKRDAANVQFAKHVCVLENPKYKGDEYAKQIIITNSHDGTSGIRFDIGLLRFVCANGLVVGSTFGAISVRHTGSKVLSLVNDTVDQFVKHFDAVDEHINELKQIQLSPGDANEYKQQAFSIRYPNLGLLPVPAWANPRRSEDMSNDLWTLYNRTQEALLKGGFKRGSSTTKSGLRTVRGIKSTSESMRINKELWDLTTKYMGYDDTVYASEMEVA